MQEEARDFEALRAELDARMKELSGQAGRPAPAPKAPEEKAVGVPRVTVAPERVVQVIEGRSPAEGRRDAYPTLEEVERRYIGQVLEAKNWRISGPKGAALVLGLNPSTLRSRMKKLGIARCISRNR